jgi:hypothetical protein
MLAWDDPPLGEAETALSKKKRLIERYVPLRPETRPAPVSEGTGPEWRSMANPPT